jgi:uncharacterized protein YecE (DUF72 family)
MAIMIESMSTTLPLFDDPPPSFDREHLAQELRALANEQIFLGGSSWKYEGWLGQIYTPQKYYTRGKFSQKLFEQRCLAEYGETFPIVCGDFSFYQFPSPEFWTKLFETVHPQMKFAFKVPEEITCKTFPSHPRYGPRSGMPNPAFLSPEMFEEGFLRPPEPYRDRIAVLIFEFGTFSKKSYPQAQDFFTDLDRFLARLPQGWRYSVEIRNDDYLDAAYFDVLRRNNVAHVFNSWNRMPPLHKQIKIAEAFTTSFTVVRALLRAGRSYEQAVEKFAPYDHIQDPNPQAREAIRAVIDRARRRREPAYLFINNRLEGNAPLTIKAILEGGM